MGNTWFTSDWHFGHDREFIYKPRGFNTIEEMNETIIQNHNANVNDDDDVFVLGDLMLGEPDNIKYIKRMRGRLHIIRGNHDTDVRIKMYSELPNVVEIKDAMFWRFRKYHFYMSHFPVLTGNLQQEHLYQMTLNLFGHTHSKEKFYEDRPYMYNVAIDAHGKPIEIENIIAEMTYKVMECKEYL